MKNLKVFTLAILTNLIALNINAANITWTNTNGTGVWSDQGNWSTNQVPASGDRVYFKSTAVANCNIDVNINVKNFRIESGYTGIITQQNGVTVTVGSEGFTQDAGQFLGGDSELNFNGAFILNGGTFSCPSQGDFKLSKAFTINGGTFTHSEATITFDGSGDQSLSVSAPLDLYNVTVSITNNKGLKVNSNDTLTVTNKLICSNGKLKTGTIHIQDTMHIESGFDDIATSIYFVGNKTANLILDGSWSGGSLYINKDDVDDQVMVTKTASGTISFGHSDDELYIEKGQLLFNGGNEVDVNFKELNIETGGTLKASSGTMKLSGNWDNNGGTFLHNNGTIKFDSNGDRYFNSEVVDTFYNFTMSATQNNKDVRMGATDTLVVQNTFSGVNGEVMYGVVLVHGAIEIGASYDGGSALVSFAGNGASTFTVDGNWTENNFYVNKANATDTVHVVSTNGTLSWGGGDYSLNIEKGVLDFPSNTDVNLNFGSINIGTEGVLVGSAGEIKFQGDWNNLGGKYVHNNGTFTFDASGDRNFTSAVVDTFYNVTMAANSNNKDIRITAGDSLLVQNKLTGTNGEFLTGTVLVMDSVVINSGYDGGSAALHFVGSTTSHFVVEANWSENNVYINKANNTDLVIINSSDNSFTIGANDYSLNITKGTVRLEGAADINYGTITIASNGTLVGSSDTTRFQGNWNNQGGIFTHNNGTFRFDASGDRTFTNNGVDVFYNFLMNPSNNKDLRLNATDTIAVANEINLNNGELKSGVLQAYNAVNIGSGFDAATSDLMLVGSNNQDLTFSSTDKWNGDLKVMKSNNSAKVTLQTKVDLDGSGSQVVFDKGIVVSSSANLFVIGDNVTVTGASTNSFVEGPVRKEGNEAFTFPVGKDNVYAPIGISAPSNSSHHFTAEFFNHDPSNDTYTTGNTEATIHAVSNKYYWDLDRTNGSSSVKVTLSWNSADDGVSTPADIIVSHWDDATEKWEDMGSSAYTGTSTQGTVTSLSAISSFSPFTIGSSSAVNALPVELLSFEAIDRGDKVEIAWATAAEINNDFFTIERSVDGRTFEKLMTIQGAGNSQAIIDYNQFDFQPLNGVSYYRLKQTDFDGTYTYSDVVVVTRTQDRAESFITEAVSFTMYPNPSNGDALKINFEALTQDAQVVVRDINGKTVVEESVVAGSSEAVLNLQGKVSTGMYLVSVVNGSQITTEKLMVR